MEPARVFVAHHAVHGVDRLIAERKRRPAEKHIQKRRDHPVREVFRHGLHRRAGNPMFIQRRRVAPDNAGHRLPRGIEALGFQRRLHAHGLDLQVPDRERLPAPDHFQREGRRRIQGIQKPQDQFT